jgi:hypothetical protein
MNPTVRIIAFQAIDPGSIFIKQVGKPKEWTVGNFYVPISIANPYTSSL